jgi:hypothetical protein
MTQILLILIIQTVFIVFSRTYFRNSSFSAYALCTQLTAQFLLIEHDIGPVSLRIYNALLLLLMLSLSFDSAIRVFSIERHKALLFTWLIFIAWILFASMVNGDADASSSFFLSDYISKQIIATICLIAFACLPRTIGDVYTIALWMGVLACLNSTFVIAQAVGIDSAWDFQRWLYPIAEDRRLKLVKLEQFFGYAPGLSAYSISASYILLCFGLIWIGFARITLSRHLLTQFAICLASIGSCILACYLCLSRSSLFLFLAILGPAAFLLFPKQRLLSSIAITAVAAASIILAMLNSEGGVSISDTRTLSADRIFSFSFEDRLSLLEETAKSIRRRPIFGGFQEGMEYDVTMSGHNMFANAALYYGIPGLVLFVLFILSVISLIKAKANEAVPNLDGKAIAASLKVAIIAYLGKGMVHNESFALGGILGMTLVGLLISATRLPISQNTIVELRPQSAARKSVRTTGLVT